MELMPTQYYAQSYADATCELHGDYQAIVYTLKDEVRQTPCPNCLRKKQREEEAQERSKNLIVSREKLLQELAFGCLDLTAFRECTFDNYVCYESNQYALNFKLTQAKNFAENFEKHSKSKVVSLWFGTCGTGKTHLAFAIINSLIPRKYSCAYIKLETLRLQINSVGAKGELELLERLTEVDFLVVDEINSLGDEKMLRMMPTLTHLVDERYMRAKATLLIGNGIPSVLSKPIQSRIKENPFCLDFNSISDYREIKLQNKIECDIVPPCAD